MTLHRLRACTPVFPRDAEDELMAPQVQNCSATDSPGHGKTGWPKGPWAQTGRGSLEMMIAPTDPPPDSLISDGLGARAQLFPRGAGPLPGPVRT